MLNRGVWSPWRASVWITALMVAACSDGATGPQVDVPALAVQDAVNNNGNEHFFWLPPMVSNPESFNGAFDPGQSPVVRICDLADCSGTVIGEFSLDEGPGGETVSVSTDDEHYKVNWHTGDFPVGPGPTYRISVLIGTTELGIADVQFGNTGRDVKNITTDEVIGLKDGRTLPIKFRIEEGALPTGPIHHWPFDGDFVDQVTGVTSQAVNVSFNGGRVGTQSAQFTNGYVDSGVIIPSGDWTVSFWRYLDGGSSGMMSSAWQGNPNSCFFPPISSPNCVDWEGVYFATTIGTFTYFRFYPDFDVRKDFVYPTQEWVNYVVTFDSQAGLLTVYEDGALFAPPASGSMGVPGSSPIYFGAYDTGSLLTNPNPLRGRLDDVKIWDRVLEAAEIQGIASEPN